MAFKLLDADLEFHVRRPDGTRLAPGMEIASVRGKARAILSAERVALNYLCHLSGVASATYSIAQAIKPYGTRVTCTSSLLAA